MATKKSLITVLTALPYDTLNSADLTTLISYIKKLKVETRASLKAVLTVVQHELEARQTELKRKLLSIGAYQTWLQEQSQPTLNLLQEYNQQVSTVASSYKDGFSEIKSSQDYASVRTADEKTRAVLQASLRERARLMGVNSHDVTLAQFVSKQKAVYLDQLNAVRANLSYVMALLTNL